MDGSCHSIPHAATRREKHILSTAVFLLPVPTRGLVSTIYKCDVSVSLLDFSKASSERVSSAWAWSGAQIASPYGRHQRHESIMTGDAHSEYEYSVHVCTTAP
jgi:hypothetical protein